MDLSTLQRALKNAYKGKGGGYSLSLSTVPAILQSPQDLILKQWRSVYDLGLMPGPAAPVLACSTLGYASYAKYIIDPTSAAWQGLAVAALGTVSIVPFTWLFILPINTILLGECDKKPGQHTLTEAQVRQTIEKWGNINLVRGILPLLSVVFGLWTALN